MTIDQAIYILRNTAWLGSNDERDETERAVEMVIEKLLSAEQEIIRCKDCKHWILDGCKEVGCLEDDFCSYAERGEQE